MSSHHAYNLRAAIAVALGMATFFSGCALGWAALDGQWFWAALWLALIAAALYGQRRLSAWRLR